MISLMDENSPRVVAQLRVVNEFEQGDLSASIPFTCWANVSLGDEALLGTIYRADVVGPFVKTRIETSNAVDKGLLGVFEEFHTPWTPPIECIPATATLLLGLGRRL